MKESISSVSSELGLGEAGAAGTDCAHNTPAIKTAQSQRRRKANIGVTEITERQSLAHCGILRYLFFLRVRLPDREASPVALQYFSQIPDPARHAFTIKVFEQWNRVFAGYTDQIFESSYIDRLRLAFFCGDHSSKLFQCGAMKDQFVVQLHERTLSQQQGDDFLAAGAVDRERCQHVLQQRNP